MLRQQNILSGQQKKIGWINFFLSVEFANEYYKIIEKARNPLFTIIKKSDYEVNDFEVLISKKVTTPKNIRIREAKKILYFPNSHVDVFYDYGRESINFKIESEIEFDYLLKTEGASSIGISAEKITNVKSLLRYLSPEGKEFFHEIIEDSSLNLNTTKNSRKIVQKKK